MVLQKLDDLNSGVILDGIGFNAEDFMKNIRSTMLVSPLKDVFKYMICRSIVSPPAMFSLCCKQIIGCKECTEQINQRCPHCRAEANANYSLIELSIFNQIIDLLPDM